MVSSSSSSSSSASSSDNQGLPGLDGASQIDCKRISELLQSDDLAMQHREPDKRNFFFIEHGGGRAFVDNGEFSLEPGSLLVVPANCLYKLQLKPETDGLRFSGSELFLRTRVAQALFITPAAFWESYYSPAAYQNLTGPERRNLREQVFREVTAAARRFGLGCDAAVMGYIFVLMTEETIPNLLSGMEPTPKLDSSDSGILYQYQILVEKHFRAHLSIEDYCRMLGVTRIKLIELCKSISEFTPLELVHKRMILEAKRELLNSSKTVNEITFELGFADSAYFSRFFKKQTGFSPSHFRSHGNKSSSDLEDNS